MSADVIDMRPDRFLRVLRDTGNWAEACDKAGYPIDEMESLCAANAKFDLSAVECQLQLHEEQIIEATEAAITTARSERESRIAKMRETALAGWRVRHPQKCDTTQVEASA